MNEEKKDLTEEERKELKENLKKQIDEMSDEELDKVAGGYTTNEEGEFICPYCGEIIQYNGGILSKIKIQGHLENHTSGIHIVYKKCDICGKSCLTEYQYNNHIKTDHK